MGGSVEIGELVITPILEQEIPLRPAGEMLPGLTAAQLDENRGWMRQAGALTDDGMAVLAIQSFLVRTPHHLVLIDTCVGNDKPRPSRPFWHMKSDTSFLDALAAAGVGVEEIDYVLCTHLHVDHVGWNTRLVDGRWVPTFPNARYVFAQDEYAYWEAENRKAESPLFTDSVLPVVEAGRAEMVAGDHGIGEHLRLLPTPGHTPGHVSVRLGRRDEAMVTGDSLHSPLQARFPELSSIFDLDPARAATTRRALLERFAETDTVCCMTHFPAPSLGRLRRWADGFRCEAL